jgi:hypothetical protein
MSIGFFVVFNCLSAVTKTKQISIDNFLVMVGHELQAPKLLIEAQIANDKMAVGVFAFRANS